MSSTDLLTPILDGAIRSIKFFNGRLLSGEDLTQEQRAVREARERVGLAVGHGVAHGLEVSINRTVTTPPTVTVQAGLAINRHGKGLRLHAAVDVALAQPAGGAARPPVVPVAGGFATCLPPQTTAYTTQAAVFLLTLGPVQTTEGTTQISGLGSGASACNARYLVDALELRLVELDFSAELADTANLPRLRSRIAARAFGSATARSFATDPFGAQAASAKLLDTLTAAQLGPGEVPLATLYWTAASGIVFVDNWSVRRPLAGPPGEGPWGAHTSPRLLAEATAMLLQFQAQVADLRAAAVPATPTATAQSTFQFLPPAGVLPIGGAQGFPVATFFGGLTIRDGIFIEAAKVESLLRVSLGYPPIDCSSPEMLFVYHVRENRFAIDHPTAGASVPVEYVVFASGQVPYFGDARCDIAHWNYSSYA
jgi:hypothetical protein